MTLTAKNNSSRYAGTCIAFHWLMLVLLIAVFSTIEMRQLFERGSEGRDAIKSWHYMLGLAVFTLVWLRLLARWIAGPAPAITPQPPHWQQTAGRSMHLLLYALMIGMPIAGWLTLSAAGEPVPYFGFHLPPLIAENEELADQIKDIHKAIGNAAYYLIALHTLAGLYHHYIRRDTTLRRMLPGRQVHH